MKTKTNKQINTLAYCDNCEKRVPYYIKDTLLTVTVKDKTFEVVIKRAHCKKCGEEVYPHDIEKENDLIVYDEYRRLQGLLTSDEIKAIRKKRGLSQVGLARLINCGDKNIARYEAGTIQDRVFDLLLRLVDDDRSYKVILNNFKKQHQLNHISK